MVLKKKKNIIILTEGYTDAYIVLGYLKNKLSIEKKLNKTFGVNLKGNQHYFCYENDENIYNIFAVGGCSQFASFFKTNLENAISYWTDKFTLVIITDADYKKDDEFLSNLIINDLKFKNSVLISNVYKIDSFSSIECETYLKILPADKPGTLETVILDSVKESQPTIVNTANEFINNLDIHSITNFTKTRHFIKGKFGLTFLLLNPEFPVCSFTDAVEKFDFSSSVAMNNVFDFLLNL